MASEEMARAFIAAGGKRPQRERTKKGTLKRSRRAVSSPESNPTPKRIKTNAGKDTWALIRKAMLVAQERTNGHLSCMECGVECASGQMLDLDHIRPKGQGGPNRPENARLVCNRFGPHGPENCHDRKHGVPFPKERSV